MFLFLFVSIQASIQRRKINEKELFGLASEVARSGVYSKMPQIDILRRMFYKYRKRLNKGNTYFITGDDFNRAYTRTIPRFTRLKDDLLDDELIKGTVKVPKIKYNNFRKINLDKNGNNYNISLDLKKTYTQELPFTWGAKVLFNKGQNGKIRSSGDSIMEIIFPQNIRPEFYSPPIAFFIPDVKIHITSLRIVKGEVFGYVIGTNLSDKRNFNGKPVYAIEFNLSTCAKNSIRKFKLSPKELKKKLENPRYFGFIN